MQTQLADEITAEEYVSAGEVLSRVSSELSKLSIEMQDVQSLVSRLVDEDGKVRPNALYSLQELDRLTQTLENLTRFLSFLSTNSNPNWEYDVSPAEECVNLAALASSLIHGIQIIEIGDEDDCDFF